MSQPSLNMSQRVRRTPYTDRVEAAGVSGFSVVNHMILPKGFGRSVEEDYWHLREHVQVWDVSCQRQVQIDGPDAERLMQWMTPRDIRGARVGQCLYLPLVDEAGGLINDPVLLKLAADRFWLSIADSDVLLWAKGLALGRGFEVSVTEPDVFPLAVQGPKSFDLMADLFGPRIRSMPFFEFGWFDFLGTRQLIARSGYSGQGGFEVYLQGVEFGPALWDAVWEAGQSHGIAPGSPNLPERIEAGLLSYGNEMTRHDNPLECGLERYCDLEADIDCLGIDALRRIAAAGVARRIQGLLFDGAPCPPCSSPWPVLTDGGRQVGHVTSAAYSPRAGKNVALAMLDSEISTADGLLRVLIGKPDCRAACLTPVPFPAS